MIYEILILEKNLTYQVLDKKISKISLEVSRSKVINNNYFTI